MGELLGAFSYAIIFFFIFFLGFKLGKVDGQSGMDKLEKIKKVLVDKTKLYNDGAEWWIQCRDVEDILDGER